MDSTVINVRMWDHLWLPCAAGGGKNKNFVLGIKHWKLHISVFHFQDSLKISVTLDTVNFPEKQNCRVVRVYVLVLS